MSTKRYYFYLIGYCSYDSTELWFFRGFLVLLVKYHQVRKINVAFLIEQNILLLYVIMSFENFYLFKSYAWIQYMF